MPTMGVANVEDLLVAVYREPWRAAEGLQALLQLLLGMPASSDGVKIARALEVLSEIACCCPCFRNDDLFLDLSGAVEKELNALCSASPSIALAKCPRLLLALHVLLQVRPSHATSLLHLIKTVMTRVHESFPSGLAASIARTRELSDASEQSLSRVVDRLQIKLQHSYERDQCLRAVGNNNAVIDPQYEPPRCTNIDTTETTTTTVKGMVERSLSVWDATVGGGSSVLDAGLQLLDIWIGKVRKSFALSEPLADHNIENILASCQHRSVTIPSWLKHYLTPAEPTTGKSERHWRALMVVGLHICRRTNSAERLLGAVMREVKLRVKNTRHLVLLSSLATALALRRDVSLSFAQGLVIDWLQAVLLNDEAEDKVVVDVKEDVGEGCGMRKSALTALLNCTACIWVFRLGGDEGGRTTELETLMARTFTRRSLHAHEWVHPYLNLYVLVSLVPVLGPAIGSALSNLQMPARDKHRILQEHLWTYDLSAEAQGESKDSVTWSHDRLQDPRRASHAYLSRVLRLYGTMCEEVDDEEELSLKGPHRMMFLPKELCELVLSFLTPRKCGRLALVNSAFSQAACSPLLWKQYFLCRRGLYLFESEAIPYIKKRWSVECGESVEGEAVPEMGRMSQDRCKSCFGRKPTVKKRHPCRYHLEVHNWRDLYKNLVQLSSSCRGVVNPAGFQARACIVVNCSAIIRNSRQEQTHMLRVHAKGSWLKQGGRYTTTTPTAVGTSPLT